MSDSPIGRHEEARGVSGAQELPEIQKEEEKSAVVQVATDALGGEESTGGAPSLEERDIVLIDLDEASSEEEIEDEGGEEARKQVEHVEQSIEHSRARRTENTPSMALPQATVKVLAVSGNFFTKVKTRLLELQARTVARFRQAQRRRADELKEKERAEIKKQEGKRARIREDVSRSEGKRATRKRKAKRTMQKKKDAKSSKEKTDFRNRKAVYEKAKKSGEPPLGGSPEGPKPDTRV